MEQSFVLFDDMRPGGTGCRLYERPVGEIVAWSIEDVHSALNAMRAAVGAGRHGWTERQYNYADGSGERGYYTYLIGPEDLSSIKIGYSKNP